jgi:hypothetical protein
MFEPAMCSGGKHLAPKSGGSCPCGMVTGIPAPSGPLPELRPRSSHCWAQCLDDGAEALDAAASRLLRERADRLLAAFTTAGLVISAGVDRLSA